MRAEALLHLPREGRDGVAGQQERAQVKQVDEHLVAVAAKGESGELMGEIDEGKGEIDVGKGEINGGKGGN